MGADKDSLTILGKLRRARAQAGRSQKEVAAWIGVSERTVHSWESAHTAPDLEQLCRWARALDLCAALLPVEPAKTGEQAI